MHTECLNCNNSNIASDIRVVDRAHGDSKRDLKLEVYEKPNALVFKGAHDASLRSDVCKDCGHVMFYIAVDKATELSAHNK
jgi:hypothetical protein